MISKLCKENKQEACMDCLSINCDCYCHNIEDENDYEEECYKDIFQND